MLRRKIKAEQPRINQYSQGLSSGGGKHKAQNQNFLYRIDGENVA